MTMNAILADEFKEKARDYLAARGTRVAVEAVHERVAAAFTALDQVRAGVSARQAACHTLPGEWSVQEIADHRVGAYRSGVDDVGLLLAGPAPRSAAGSARLPSNA